MTVRVRPARQRISSSSRRCSTSTASSTGKPADLGLARDFLAARLQRNESIVLVAEAMAPG